MTYTTFASGKKKIYLVLYIVDFGREAGLKKSIWKKISLTVTFSLFISPAWCQEIDCKDWKSHTQEKIFWEKISYEILSECIEKNGVNFGFSVNDRAENGATPLHFAAIHSKRFEVIEALLLSGAEANSRAKDGITPLALAAARSSSPEVLRALVKYGADINAKDARGLTPLISAAAMNSNPLIIKILFELGADIDARFGEQHFSALHIASSNNVEPDIIHTLIELGINPNSRTIDGMSPLHFVGANPSAGLIGGALIRSGANLNARDSRGQTPLHVYAQGRNLALVEASIAAGIEVNARDKNGSTPLMYAARFNSSPEGPLIILSLLEGGADATIKDRIGEDAFDYAQHNIALVDTHAYWALSDARYK